VGTYNPNNGSTSLLDCQPCIAGYCCPNLATIDPVTDPDLICPAGHYCPRGTGSCDSLLCPGRHPSCTGAIALPVELTRVVQLCERISVASAFVVTGQGRFLAAKLVQTFSVLYFQAARTTLRRAPRSRQLVPTTPALKASTVLQGRPNPATAPRDSSAFRARYRSFKILVRQELTEIKLV